MGFKSSGPPPLTFSLLKSKVCNNFSVHLSSENIFSSLLIRLVRSACNKIILAEYVITYMRENNSNLKRASSEKLVKHLLLNSLNSATLASKNPIQQYLRYHINV